MGLRPWQNHLAGGGKLDPWLPIMAIPEVIDVWAAGYGQSPGAKVSAWTSRKKNRTISWGTASEQPDYVPLGPCPSRAPALYFTAASSQKLQGTPAETITVIQDSEHHMMPLYRLASVGAQMTQWCAGDSTSVTLARSVATATTGWHQCYDGANSKPNPGGHSAGVDYWWWGRRGSITDNQVELKDVGSGSDSLTSVTLTAVDTFTVGARWDNGTFGSYHDGWIYGIVVADYTVSPVPLQILCDAVMGYS